MNEILIGFVGQPSAALARSRVAAI